MADRWIEKVLDVKRVSKRLMVRVIVGRFVLNLISVYAPQTGMVKGGKREVSSHVGGSSVGDRFW